MQIFAFDLNEIPSGLAAVAGLAIVKFGSIYYLQNYGKKNWVWAGKVSRLFVYPVKSCKGIEVDELVITPDGGRYGPVKDRHWMVIDRDGQRVTQRICQNMALITQTLCGDKLHIDAPGMETLKLDTDVKVDPAKMIDIKLSGRPEKALYSGDDAHRWFCRYLERDDLRLVQMTDDMESIPMMQFNKPYNYYARKGDVKGLHDKAPFNMLSQPSVADLAKRVPDIRVDVHRFRPNVLVEGCQPYDEDTWKHVQVGENVFTRIAMCSRYFVNLLDRCIFVTVDQEEPNKAGDAEEPLVTLRNYRLGPEKNGYGRSPILGAHFCPDTLNGTIRVGDDVFVVKEHY